MSSLRALASLKPKGWVGVSSLIRNSADTALLNSKNRTNHSSVANYYLSTNHRDKVESSSQKNPGVSTTSSFVKSSLQPSDSVEDDIINEILPKEITFSKSFVKDCQFKVHDWVRQMKVLQNAGKEIQIHKIVGKFFSQVIELSVTPSAPPDILPNCLALLLSVPDDGKTCIKMLQHTIDSAMHLPIKSVADIVQNLSEAVETPLRKKTRIELVTTVVNKRWYEIGGKHAVFFMYQLDELFDMRNISHQIRNKNKAADPSVKEDSETDSDNDSNQNKHDSNVKSDTSHTDIHNKVPEKSKEHLPDNNSDLPVISINIETRAISLVNELKVKDLARIVILLAKWRSRNQTLLNAIMHRLCQDDFRTFQFVQLNNLLFACSTLSLHNPDILRKVTAQLSQKTFTTPSQVCAMLTSLSYLRWRDDDLILKVRQFLEDHMSSLSPKDANNALMSLANLYTLPSTQEESKFIKDLAGIAFGSDTSAAERVNCVWCLTILQSLDAETAEEALQPEFVQQFSDLEDIPSQIQLQKLRFISLAAKYEIEGYTGPLLSEEILNSSQTNTACNDKVLSAALVNALRKFADLSTYTKLTQCLPGGITVDAVMCANNDGEVRPLSSVEGEDKGQMHMLAFQLVPFAGVVSPSETPIGSFQLTARHLKHLGYVPIQILYSDLRPSQSGLEHITNIKRRIKDTITNSTSS